MFNISHGTVMVFEDSLAELERLRDVTGTVMEAYGEGCSNVIPPEQTKNVISEIWHRQSDILNKLWLVLDRMQPVEESGEVTTDGQND